MHIHITVPKWTQIRWHIHMRHIIQSISMKVVLDGQDGMALVHKRLSLPTTVMITVRHHTHCTHTICTQSIQIWSELQHYQQRHSDFLTSPTRVSYKDGTKQKKQRNRSRQTWRPPYDTPRGGRHTNKEHGQLFTTSCSNPLHCIYYTSYGQQHAMQAWAASLPCWSQRGFVQYIT